MSMLLSAPAILLLAVAYIGMRLGTNVAIAAHTRCHHHGGCPSTIGGHPPPGGLDPSLLTAIGLTSRSTLLSIAGPVAECILTEATYDISSRLFGAADLSLAQQPDEKERKRPTPPALCGEVMAVPVLPVGGFKLPWLPWRVC